MEQAATGFGAIEEATVFSQNFQYFKDMPDRRRKGKVVYPLEEFLVFRCWRGRRPSSTSRGSTRKSSIFCAGSGFATARHHIIVWATFSPPSTAEAFSALLCRPSGGADQEAGRRYRDRRKGIARSFQTNATSPRRSSTKKPITASRSKVIRDRCTRMSNSSQKSRKQGNSRTRRSVGMKRSTLIMAVSKPESTQSATSVGFGKDTTGRD
jgi:hypothetical protein